MKIEIILTATLLTLCYAVTQETHPRQTGKSVLMFDVEPNGNASRVLEHYVGQVSLAHCVAHCSHKQMPYGGWNDTNRHCFCGYREAGLCNGNSECLESLDTSAIHVPDFTAAPPLTVKMFENISLSIDPHADILNYGIVTNGKLTTTPLTDINIMFTEMGNASLAAEHEAYWSCRSETHYVQVVPGLEAMVTCPEAVEAGVEFTCSGGIVSGTDITEFIWQEDGSDSATVDLNGYNIEPMHYYAGGVLRTDRFNAFVESYNRADGERSAFIDINYEFKSHGVLKAFETYVTHPGCLRFMVLKPTCLQTGYLYCNALKECVNYMSPSFTPCGDPEDLMSFTPPSEDAHVFCSDALRFTNETMITCPAIEGVVKPMADYKIMWSYEAWAYTLGNSVFTIPPEQYYSVKPGYVTGWAPCDGADAGDIGYYPMDDTFGENYPTFVYDEVFTIVEGAVFAESYPMATTNEISFMLQAHVFSTIFFTETFTGATPGGKVDIGVMVSTATEISELALREVKVFDNITGLTAAIDKPGFYPNTEITVTVTMDTGAEGAEYCYHWGEVPREGDECDYTSSSNELTHLYGDIAVGRYEIYVGVKNMISTESVIVPIDVLGTLSSIKYLEPIEPTEIHAVSRIHVEASGTGSATLRVTIMEDIYEYNVTLSPSFILDMDLRYEEEVAGLAVVELFNALDSIETSSYMVVQEPVSDVTLVPFGGIAATNESIIYQLVDHPGSNVTYKWDFGDGTIKWTNGTFNVNQMEHTYQDFGMKTVIVTCWNVLSEANFTFDVMVQDTIKGFVFTRESMNGQFGEPTVVSFMIEQGSGINITIDYGYHGEVFSPTALDMAATGTALYGQGSYTYPAMGEYEITVSIANPITSNNISMVAIITEGITELNVSMIQEVQGDVNKDWIEEGERLTICVNVTGHDVTFTYDFGDGRPSVVTQNMTIDVVYDNWREEPYVVQVTATNVISEMIETIPIPVKQPVENMTGFEVTNAPGNATEPIVFQLTKVAGDLFTCTWNWTDGSEATVVTYDQFLATSGFISHVFTAGVFNVEVFCENRLYNVSLTVETFSYSAVTKFDIYAYQDCHDGQGLQEGKGETGDVFDINCEIVFSLDGQEGTNVTDLFKFGYSVDGKQVEEIGSTTNETRHTYLITDPSFSYIVATVEVESSNPTSSYTRSLPITIIGGIKNVTLQLDDGINRINTPSNISVYIENAAYKACYEIDLGDPSAEKILFGDPDCIQKPEFASHRYVEVELIPGEYVLVTSHTYPAVGNYDLKVVASNDVSVMNTEEEVKIKDLPCFPPKLAWDAAITTIPRDALDESSFFKCMRTVLNTKLVPDCQKTTAVPNRSWKLEMITYINETDTIIVNETLEIPGNDSRHIIEKRALDYGFYRIQYVVDMYDTERDVVIEDTEAVLSGFFHIKKCDLVGFIVGGSGRAIGHGAIAVVDASQSEDPDREPGTDHELTFEWFCKQDNQDDLRKEFFELELPNLINYPSSIHPAAKNKSVPRTDYLGCFGNKHGKLVIPLEDPSILKLDTNYMAYSQVYNILLRISQVGREEKVIKNYVLKVVYGEPPIVSISCKLNCLAKKNPTQKISFLAVCDNCGSQRPIYQWSMTSVAPSSSDPAILETKNATELLRQRATTNIEKDQNLVISPNSLSVGIVYTVKLSVYWDLNDPENGGFSQYEIAVNTPPVGPDADCYFNIDKGIALTDEFVITCEGIDDVDKPLTYNWYYRTVDGDLHDEDTWKTCTFPKKGPPQSDPFTLPAGNPDRRNLVQIRVIVEDLYGAGMDPIFFEVEVTPKEIDADAVSALLDNPAALSDPAVMGNVMNGLLDSMKASPDAVKVNVAEVKDKMVEMLANVRIDSASGCAMVAGTLNSATDEGSEMSDNGLEKSLQASANIASFGAELSPEQLADIAKKTLSATSKFTSNVKGANAAENMRASRESELALTSGAAANMVAGEASMALSTANGVTKVSCIDPNNKEGGGGVAGFDMPTIPGDEEIPPGSCTGATNSEGKNRYGFEESAKGVHGDTKGLSLSSGFGKKREVKNLPKPIRLVLPNNEEIPPPESHPAYCELMRVIHLVECSVNASNLFMKIEPWYNNFTGNMFVFMNKGTTPSLTESQHNCTLPIPYPENYDNMTAAQQYHFETEERWRCMVTASQMEDYCEGRWCVGVIYYTNTTNQTTELKPRSYPVADAQCKKLNYTFYAYTRACLYWSESKKIWSNEGCVVSTETSDNETICYCDHLTDFGGGGPLAEPQPIDFGAAFNGFSNLGENPTVFSVVLALIVVYFLMLIWARRADKKDAVKVAICPLESNHPNDTYFYELNVQTGFKTSSHTTSEVFIVLRGSQSETLPKQLKNPGRDCFLKGETDNFLLAVPYSLGGLKEIEVWHNNKGASPGWFLMQVAIRDLQTDKKDLFVCNKWLDVAEEDGLICRTMEPAKKEDLTEFSFAFAQTIRKNLYDGHIWFSVFTRPLESTFTRVQRLSTCFSLLLTTMLANAMFYTGDDKPPSFAISVGPITVSIDQIRVGITSALIVIPANLLIITLFKKAGPKRDKTAEKYMTGEDEEETADDELATARLDEEQAPPQKPPAEYNLDVMAPKKSVVSSSQLLVGTAPIVAGVAPAFDQPAPPVEEYPEEDDEAARQRRNKRGGIVRFFKSILFPGREDDDVEKENKRKNPLPHWLIYIAYFFVFITCAVSAFFVILYGFTFGKAKSDQWIISMLISFLQSVFMIQPIKVVVLSLLFAYLTKDPTKDDEHRQRRKTPGQAGVEDEEDEETDVDEELEEDAKNAYKKKKDTFKMPDERKLEECRQQRLMEKRIKAIIKEIVVHLMFVFVCLMVAYAAADPASYHLTESVRHLAELNGVTNAYFGGKTYNEELGDRKVKKAHEVSTRLEWFDWMRFSMVEYLFPIGWYNGDKDYDIGFVADNMPSKVLAMARIRQLRVKNNTCTKLPTFEHLIVECNAAYSIGAVEQTANFHYGWTPPLNRTSLLRLRRGKRKALYLGLETPWLYQSALELSAFPFFGKFAIYNGASYSVSIGPKKKFAKKIVQAMKDNFWVDRYSRALITEANIYNANTNLLLIVTMIHEILPTGGWKFYYNIQSLRLYRYVGGLGSLIMIFDFIFVVITIVGLYRAVKYSKRRGFMKYIKNPWNLLHVIVTGFSFGAIACTIGRALSVRTAIAQYLDEPELFVSFAYVGQLEYFIMACIGFVVFFANLEFLRILRFNRRIGLLTKTMSIVGKPLSSFAILFLIIFMGYVSFAHCLFVDKLEGFSGVVRSFVELMKMFLGSFSWDDFQNSAPILGPLMFFTYMLAIQMVLINMFIGIVCDSFAEVREEADNDEEANILSFIGDRLKKVTGAGIGGPSKPIYNEWKTDWEEMMEKFEEHSDNIVYNIKNVETDEVRHAKWFNPKRADNVKRNMIAAVLGVDYFMYETEILDGIQALERKMKRMTDEEANRFLHAAVLKRTEDVLAEEQNGRMTASTDQTYDSNDSDDFSSTEDEDSAESDQE